MFKLKPLWLLLASAGLVAGCMSAPDKQALRIEPLLSIRDALNGARDQYEIGRYYQGQKRYAKARLAYEKALASDPGHAQAANNLAVIEASQGHYERAIIHFRLALAQQADDAATHNNLGYVYLLQQQPQAAQAEFEVALRLAPNHARAAANLAAARQVIQLAETATTPSASVADSRPVPPPAQPVAGTLTSGAAEPAVPLPRPEVAPTPETPPPTVVAPTELVASPPAAISPPEASALAIAAETVAPAAATTVPPEGTAPSEATSVAAGPAGMEISNGNGVTGMALRLRGFLRSKGMDKARLTNERPFVRQETVIAYRSGFEDSARALNSKLPREVALHESAALRPGTDVRLLLGKDIALSGRTPDSPTPSWLALLK